MNDFLAQIRAATSANLYYLALFCSLTLPDICSSLESLNGKATKKGYIQWFDKYVAPKYYGFLDGSNCYKFRCSILHQGTTLQPYKQYSRIIFLEPNSSGVLMHNNILDDVLNIDIRIFCEDIVTAVEFWLPLAQQLPYFAANIDKFVSRHSEALLINVNGAIWIG